MSDNKSLKGRLMPKSKTDAGAAAGTPAVKRPAVLYAFIALNALVVLIAAITFIANLVILILVKDLSHVEMAVRVYILLFCLVVVAAELDWTAAMKEFNVLNSWIFRGAAYAFIGLLTLQFADDESGGVTAAYFIKAAGWIQVGVGVVYFLLGIACVNKLKAKKQTKYDDMVKAQLSAPVQQPAPASEV